MKRQKNAKKVSGGLKPLITVSAVSVLITVLLGVGVLFYYFAPRDNGARVVIVPEYVGMDEADIGDGEVFVIEREWIHSSSAPIGTVISQTPSAGSRRKLSADGERCAVTVRVSLGERIERVPHVVGMDYMSAAAILRGMGAAVRSVSVYDTDGADGEVLGCSPDADERLDMGQTVTLYVKRDRVERPITVPELVGRGQEEASIELLSLGLTLGEIEYSYSAEYASGEVMSQSLPPNIHVVYGTRISLTVSLGSPDVWPDSAVSFPITSYSFIFWISQRFEAAVT